MRVTVLSARLPPRPGGVSDYTRAWCRAMLELERFELTVITEPGADLIPGVVVDAAQSGWGVRAALSLRAAIAYSRPDVIVVQYVPHSFGRRGAGLPFCLTVGLIARSLGVPLIVNGHELYGDWTESLRRLPWTVAQRLGLAVLLWTGSTTVVTVEARRQRLLGFLRRHVQVIPIGPTVLPAEPNPDWRAEHGIAPDTVMLASFGLGHWSQDSTTLALLLDRLGEEAPQARLCTAGGLRVEHPAAVNLGYLPPLEMAEMLSSADLFVLPLTDGASGRRSSLISALGSGAPILSTRGVDTDPRLFGADLRLTPAGNAEAFVRAAVALSQDGPARDALRASGAALFDRSFSWPVVARRWAQLLDETVSRA